MSHTPGPWHANDDGEVFGPDFGASASGRIAKVLPRQAIGVSGPHENRLRAEANARLIAAAPDLLAALEGYMAAVSQMKAAMDDGFNVQGAVSELIGWTDLAGAAIKKARGE